jgi:phospholipase C
MLENRSLDNMLGTLYLDCAPSWVLPATSAPSFDGLRPGLSNPSNRGYFAGEPEQSVAVANSVASSTVPDPDPEETFANVSYQLFGPDAPTPQPRWPMQGFVVNYATTGASDPTQIMQCHSPAQVPVLASLARNYAVCDAWFASVPSQTWANRAFLHAGTSNGHVDNGSVPDPLEWNVPTIFNVLESVGASWAVYHDTTLVPSLTRTMFPQLWSGSLDANFKTLEQFVADCAQGGLPQYAFLEPSFLIEPNDEHPPHDVNAGEALLQKIWSAVSTSPDFAKILLVITFDEHGGCYDHVLPPFGAVPPDAAGASGDQGFGFDRFGVRVPAVIVSSYIRAGTVFRSDTATPYDHTSILATLRDWLQIPSSAMLSSRRVAAAPTLAQLLTLSAPRSDVAVITGGAPRILATPNSVPPNDLQRSLVSGDARRRGLDPNQVLSNIHTRQHAIDYFATRAT